MDLKNKRILIAAQFAAPYAGNFLPSLESLEKRLCQNYGAECAYLLPRAAERCDWYARFSGARKCYLSGNESHLITKQEAGGILTDFHPDIIYTHFEGYDLPMYNAARKNLPHARLVWHMHDTLSYVKHPVKAAYQAYCFFRHYGMPLFFNRVNLIAVNPHELRFVRKFRGYKKIVQDVIPNGVETSRLSLNENRQPKDNRIFTFLAYGGRNIQKRIDLILKAAEILSGKGYNFKIVITKGTDTQAVVDQYFSDRKPRWLELIDQVSDINQLLESADCFICSSANEGCSYAIIEALMKGLPVIQSEIEGTIWTHDYPNVLNFKSLDYLALSAKMEQIMNSEQCDIYDKCLKGSEMAFADFSLETWSDRVIDFFGTI